MVATALLILTIILITVFSSSSSASNDENVVTIYDFNSSWIPQNYSAKRDAMPLLDTNDNLLIAYTPQDQSSVLRLDFLNKREPCTIHPNLTYKYDVENKAYILGDGRILFKLKDSDLLSEDSMSSECKVFIIDLKDCSRRNLTWIEEDYSEKILDILPYYNTFDVVLKHGQVTHPELKIERFDDQAKKLKFSATIQVQDKYFGKILSSEKNDPSGGYYYIVPTESKTQTILKKLNDKFEIVKTSANFSHHTDYSYSANHGKFYTCSLFENSKNLTCQIFDENLSNITSTTVHVSKGGPISFVTMTNLSEGGIMIVFAKQSKEKKFTFYAQKLDKQGEFINPVELGKNLNIQGDFSHIQLLEMKNGSILVAVVSTESILTKLIVKKTS